MTETLAEKTCTPCRGEIERIENAVSRIRIPLTFTDQLYNLRSHIDIVRRKFASRANETRRMVAE